EDHSRGARSLQRFSILSLMIVSGLRKRNHDRGFACRDQFRSRGRSSATEHEIRFRKIGYHVVNITTHLSAFVPTQGVVTSLYLFKISSAGLMLDAQHRRQLF